VRVFGLVAVLMAIAGVAVLPATSVADGPYEPNETAAMASVPHTAPTMDAGLETPQDQDWYLLYPQGVRQIGVLATVNTLCRASYGSVTMDLLDAEGSRSPVDAIRLGYDPAHSKVAVTAATMSFTSQVGHRYLLHVTQSGCDGVAYSMALAPVGALGTTLMRTKTCTDGIRAERRSKTSLTRLRAARRRAHGVRRKQLGAKIQLQSQQVVRAKADTAASCARTVLTGYPWE
jgi:hypothetical protein